MYEMFLMNRKGERFTKTFYSKYLFDKFLLKVRYGRNLQYLGYRRIN